MLKIGHRGAKGYAAENTLASFKKALELNVDAVELDVHLSLDNDIMVIHDKTIDRTTTQKGFVNKLSTIELIQLGVPTLSEIVLFIDKKCVVNIEIKDAKATYKVIELIDNFVNLKKWDYNLFQVSSFNWTVLETVSKINSNILIGVLTENCIEKAIVFAKKIKAHSINPFYKLLNNENTKFIHQNKFKIYTWTVNSIEDITFIKKLNVDGIISDYPDRI